MSFAIICLLSGDYETAIVLGLDTIATSLILSHPMELKMFNNEN